eukprot:g18777.t1
MCSAVTRPGFRRPRSTSHGFPVSSNGCCKACLAHGLIVLPTGIFETIRIIPPLTVSEEECEQGLKIFQEALEACLT